MLLNYFRVRAMIPGNSNLVVGMVINIDIYGMDYETFSNPQNRKEDSYLTGKYLITSVRHIISPNRYITVLELCKDSIQPSY